MFKNFINRSFTCFQAHITQPHTFPTTNTQHSPTQLNNVKTTPPPPPPRWAKPPFTKPSLSPKSEAFSPINKVSQNGNITVTTTVTFCVNNTQIHNHQINESIQSDRLQLTLASNAVNNNGSADSVFSIMDATKNIADSNGESQVRIITLKHDCAPVYALHVLCFLLMPCQTIMFVSNTYFFFLSCILELDTTNGLTITSCSCIEYDAPYVTRRRVHQCNDS